jgi:putative tryptophan/tyrosine transport system substrate-binding protein
MPNPFESAADIERTFESFARVANGGLVVLPDPSTAFHRDHIIALAARHRLPSVYHARFFVVAGGLMSYGIDRVDLFRQTTTYVDRILRGASPADLPVQAPTKYETVVNLKTATALARISHTRCGLRCSFGEADTASGGEKRIAAYG